MEDDIVAELLLGLNRRRSNGDGCIPGERLEHYASERLLEFGGLFGDDEAVIGIGDDDRRSVALPVRHPKQGLLEKAGMSG